MVSHWCTTGTSHPHRREKTTQTASHTQRTDGCPLPLLAHTPAQPDVIPEFRKRQTTLERRIIREEEDRLPPSPFRIRDVLGPSHPSHSLAHYARQPFTYCFALEGDHPGIWLCFRPSRRRCPRYLGKCSYHDVSNGRVLPAKQGCVARTQPCSQWTALLSSFGDSGTGLASLSPSPLRPRKQPTREAACNRQDYLGSRFVLHVFS